MAKKLGPGQARARYLEVVRAADDGDVAGWLRSRGSRNGSGDEERKIVSLLDDRLFAYRSEC
jgi:hypothetical protein